ncbi:MAG: response regulator receiver protein, partial [Rhodocyclaceae bacterium]|nr:response regulator receiver protein [Rhodocyclaceae bacterium]
MIPTAFNPAQTSEIDFSSKTFLIVDDFQGMRTVIRDVLRNCGANSKLIETAANGKDAVRLLGAQPFDVVLCDFNLGPGQNGQQVLEEAKVKQLIGPACAWVMITAEKTTEAVTGAAEYQPDAYLLKPITEATLRNRLAKIWARKAMFADIDRAIRSGDYAKAIRLCDERIRTDKANGPELARTKADLLVKSGNLQQARQVFEAVLAERDFPWAKAGLAKVLVQNGELEPAKSLLQETIHDSPYYLEAHDLLAHTFQALGELDAAAQSLEHATKLSPNSVARQKTLGDVSLKLGRLDHAERAFRKSVTLGEHSVLKAPDAFFGLAKTCSAKDNPMEALKVLGELNKTFTDDQTRLKSMAIEGIVHHKTGNFKKAVELAAAVEREVAAGGA